MIGTVIVVATTLALRALGGSLPDEDELRATFIERQASFEAMLASWEEQDSTSDS